MSQPNFPLSIESLIDSARDNKALMVECFSRKPNCRGYSNWKVSKKLYNRLCINFSIILEKTDRIELGW